MLLSLPYINEAFILLSAFSIAIGWWQIRLKRLLAHKRFMILGTVFAGLFFIGYSIKAITVGATSFGGPEAYQAPYQIFLLSHTVLATVAAVLGVITLVFAYRQSFGKHRKIGRWTSIIWFVTVGTGLAVFLLLYVIFPSGANAELLRVLFGS